MCTSLRYLITLVAISSLFPFSFSLFISLFSSSAAELDLAACLPNALNVHELHDSFLGFLILSDKGAWFSRHRVHVLVKCQHSQTFMSLTKKVKLVNPVIAIRYFKGRKSRQPVALILRKSTVTSGFNPFSLSEEGTSDFLPTFPMRVGVPSVCLSDIRVWGPFSHAPAPSLSFSFSLFLKSDSLPLPSFSSPVSFFLPVSLRLLSSSPFSGTF